MFLEIKIHRKTNVPEFIKHLSRRFILITYFDDPKTVTICFLLLHLHQEASLSASLFIKFEISSVAEAFYKSVIALMFSLIDILVLTLYLFVLFLAQYCFYILTLSETLVAMFLPFRSSNTWVSPEFKAVIMDAVVSRLNLFLFTSYCFSRFLFHLLLSL